MDYTKCKFGNAKVMAKGQITLPKEFREILNVDTGDKVSLVFDGERIFMMNPAIFAMKVFQQQMEGEAERAGFKNEEDAMDFIYKMRKGEV